MHIAMLLCLQLVTATERPPAKAVASRWQQQASELKSKAIQHSLFDSVNSQSWLKAGELADSAIGADGTSLWQHQAWAYSMLGRLDLVREMERRGFLPFFPAPCGTEPSLSEEKIIEEIVSRAKSTRVVILQELHAFAHHRLLLHHLLPALHAIGYRTLAAEDFRGTPEPYGAITHPGQVSGFHSVREPVFADAIRKALALGYALVPYEVDFPPPPSVEPKDWQQWREERQAENLAERILRKDKTARVLVFAGTNHGQEVAIQGYRPMGLILREKTGVNPLSIDQSICRLESRSESSAGMIEQPNGDGTPSGYDVRVALRTSRFVEQRPEWLRSLARVDVELRSGFRSGSEPIVVESRLLSEPPESPPVDRVYLGRGERLPLLLPPGSFRVTVHTRRGSRSYTQTVGGEP